MLASNQRFRDSFASRQLNKQGNKSLSARIRDKDDPDRSCLICVVGTIGAAVVTVLVVAVLVLILAFGSPDDPPLRTDEANSSFTTPDEPENTTSTPMELNVTTSLSKTTLAMSTAVFRTSSEMTSTPESVTFAKKYAKCLVVPDPGQAAEQNVTGVVTFSQEHPKAAIHIKVLLEGFAPEGSLHGFHVHEHGDIVNGCSSAGGHYNPSRKNHGGPADTERHPGDFGNLQQDSHGKVNKSFTDPRAQLFGDHSIIGRAIVIHKNADDLGKGGNPSSLANGNAGPRLACCVIESAPGEK